MFTWLPFEKYLTPDLLRVLMPLGEKEVFLKQNCYSNNNILYSKRDQ